MSSLIKLVPGFRVQYLGKACKSDTGDGRVGIRKILISTIVCPENLVEREVLKISFWH